MNRAVALGLAGLAVLVGGCEPTEAEAGQAALLSAVPITLIALGLQWAYAWLWRPFQPAPRIQPRVPGMALATLFILGVVVLLSGMESGVAEWIGFVFFMVGTSYLTFYVIALRIMVIAKLRPWFSWVIVVPWVLLLPPAIFLAFSGSTTTHVPDLLSLFYIFSGMGGWLSGPLAVLLFGEAGVRRYMHYRRTREPPPPGLPRSIVVRDRARVR